MTTEFTKATLNDYEEVIDLANLVFSMDREPHDFPILLPKLCKRENFMDGTNYLAKEDGKIKAIVGAYPLELNVCGKTLDMRGIGMVSAHPYARSRGYMKSLMNMALDDMKREGAALSCLGGQRQRYEYFGYAPAGTENLFQVRWANIRHILGRDHSASIKLKKLSADNGAALDYIHAKYVQRPGYIRRNREKLFDILTSWKFVPYIMTENEKICGYLLTSSDSSYVDELEMEDMSRLPEALGELLKMINKTKDRDRIQLPIPPHHTDTLQTLNTFAETCSCQDVYHYNIFDYQAVLEAFCALRCQLGKVTDGSIAFRIEGDAPLLISIQNNVSTVEITDADPVLHLTRLEATRLLFSPILSGFSPDIAENPFLQSLLPLPLFQLATDAV